MNQIFFQLVHSCIVKMVICGDTSDAVLNNFEFQQAVNPSVLTTGRFVYQDVASLSEEINESQNDTRYESIQRLEHFKREQSHAFDADCKGIVRFRKLLQIHGCTWENDRQNILYQVSTILFNKNTEETSKYFKNVKNKLDIFSTCAVPSRRIITAVNKENSRGMNSAVTKKQAVIVCCNTADKYVYKLKKTFSIVSTLRKEYGSKNTVKPFFELLSSIIFVNDYANEKNMDEITMKELDLFLSICIKIDFSCFYNTRGKYQFINHLKRLSVNSLYIFSVTRIREKCFLLPEFTFLHDLVTKFLETDSKIANFNRTCIIYVVSRIEIIISKMINLNKEIITTQNTLKQNESEMITYRSFIREIFISNLLLLIQTYPRYICKYILLSRLEHSYLCIRASTSADRKIKNFYTVTFLVFSTFTVKGQRFITNLLSNTKADTNIHYINNNEIVLKSLGNNSKRFKRIFKKKIRKLFCFVNPRLAKFKKLRKVIFTQIDKLNEQNPRDMLLKVNFIYNFVRIRLLAEDQSELS